jgi:diguanylate cyclase
MERFREELKRAFRYQFPLSVLMVDVDHFKSYNDKFGHLVGDKTLREVAQIIRDNVRRVDVIGRYGGEEFVIAAPEIEKKKGLELAERIRLAVAQKHFQLYDEETHATVSIGVSSFPIDLEVKEFSEIGLTELIQKADQALYEAKVKGRNRIVAYSKNLD